MLLWCHAVVDDDGDHAMQEAVMSRVGLTLSCNVLKLAPAEII